VERDPRPVAGAAIDGKRRPPRLGDRRARRLSVWHRRRDGPTRNSVTVHGRAMMTGGTQARRESGGIIRVIRSLICDAITTSDACRSTVRGTSRPRRSESQAPGRSGPGPGPEAAQAPAQRLVGILGLLRVGARRGLTRWPEAGLGGS
jgi:hypothetical protein